MVKKSLLLFLAFFSVTTLWAADVKEITGTVSSAEDKELLIGVTITVPRSELKRVGAAQTSLGTTTDVDGNFTIKVPTDVKVLTASYIGYEDAIITLTDGKSHYDVVMKSKSTTLNDVVVTGYQTVERRRLTAAITKIDLTEAAKGSNLSVDQALAGQIAGVSVTSMSGTPGAPAKIRIRGTASLSGTQDPLWVLDGMPLEGTDIPKLSGNSDNDITNIGQSSIAGLSPNDIESITILKDAAATAIYGARAANGVIVITTKRGREGKPVMNYNTRLSISPRISSDRLNLLNASQKVNLELEMARQTYDNYGTPVSLYSGNGDVYAIIKNAGELENYQAKGFDALSAATQGKINALRNVNTNWNDILFRSAFTQEHNFSISGGGERVTYYNSVGYSDENGNVQGVSNSRFNLTSKTQYKVNKILKIGFSLFGNLRKNHSFLSDTYGLNNPVYYSRIANPYQILQNEDGSYAYDYNAVANGDRDLTRGFNIFEDRANSQNKTTTTSINAIFDAELRFNDNWKLTTQLGLQYDNSKREQYAGWNTFTMRNAYQNSRYTNKGVTKYVIPEGGRMQTNHSTTTQMTYKLQGEYKNTFNDIHFLQLMAGTEWRKNWYKADAVTAYGYNPQTLTSIPLVFQDEKQARQYPLNNFTKQTNAYISFYATGSYTLLDRYTLGASVRSDGSDLFGVDKKYRWLPIYSMSALWRVSREKFLSSATWIDNLALRLSYGIQGNIDKNTSPYLVGSYANISILPGYNETGINILGAPNDKLRWEKTKTWNVGIDWSILKSAINMSFDYYSRKGTDLIGTRMLPLENGFQSMTINWASMKNEGVEFNLQTRNIATKNFSWYTTFNFAYNQNKVLRMSIADNQTTPSLEGYPVGAIFAIETKGIDPKTGRILLADASDPNGVTIDKKYRLKDEWGIGFYSSDVKPTEERTFYKYMGTSDAPYTGGLMNTFNYKNWELNMNWAFYFGAKVRTAPSYAVVGQNPGRNTNTDILNRWTPDNTTSSLPALLSPTGDYLPDYRWLESSSVYNNLDIWVRDLNYARMQNLRLSYHLPEEFVRKLGLGAATIAVEGKNLFVISADYHNYIDPESQSNLYSTPVQKAFTFNLNVNF